MKLITSKDCCACSYCYRTCPVGAPYFDGIQNQIDQNICISCGKCIDVCPMGAIIDSENPPQKAERHNKMSYSCDTLIIGAGASGMTTAVRLAEQGKQVIVIEKEKRTGSGALHVAGPMQIVDTKWALDAGETPHLPQKIQDTIAYGKGKLDAELVKNTLCALPRFFDWMCSFTDMTDGFELIDAKPMAPPPMPKPELPEGVEISDVEQEAIIAGGGMPGSAMGGNLGLVVQAKSYSPEAPMFHNPGEYIMTRLFARAEELGVTILRQTTAKQLIRDASGKFTGLLAEDAGGEVEFHYENCLIATGSLLLSDAVKKVEPEFADCFQPKYGHTIQAYTGDGFAMCEEAGIPVRYEDIWLNITGNLVMPCDGLTVEYAEAAKKKPMMPSDLRGHSNRPEALVVNVNGERFESEQMACISFKEQMRQPKGLSYAIFEEDTIKGKTLPWIPVLDENGKAMKTMMPMGMPTPPWNEENMQYLSKLKDKHLVIADTIQDLAEQLEMDPNVLKKTVDRYNSLCEKKSDDDYQKHWLYLKPVKNGPFYAIKTFLMSDGAEGGIPIDAECHVMGKEGPISNLFAAGDNSSGNIVIDENHEKIWITNEFSWALSSGMIVADAILSK